jgi:OmcA/MtrC family decaheme c-type cytochrome
MRSPRKGLVTALATSALVVFPLVGGRLTRVVDRSGQVPTAAYTPKQKEFWLPEELVTYVRPGFHITVNSVTIGPDRRPVVDLSFTDDLGQPLDRTGAVTPGTLSVSMILAWYDPGVRHYTSYTTRVQTSTITGASATQAAADSGGTWNDVEVGHSVYTFKTALPEGFDQTKTTTLGIYATRNTTDIVGKNYYANVEYDFRPDGGQIAATDTWDKTNNAACNTCHNPLSAHGGSRQDVKLCVLCHQPQTTDPDTGNTVDFKVMVHKIHMGENLPSVEAGTPYQIIGFQNSVVDFSTVAFPQDIRNCQTCHETAGAPGAASQTNVWYTYPSRAACQSCHDDVDFTTGANHPAGPYTDDSQCASCHQPQGSHEWDASVIGAHTVPYKSTQLIGLQAEIVSVTNAAPGQTPTMQFRITDKNGAAVAPSFFTTASGGSDLNLLMGGPTADYAINPFRERGDHSSFDGTTATYTFTHAIPADATGTWAFSIEARHATPLDPHPANATSFTEGAINPVAYASLSGGDPEPRRKVVELANCNTCHDRLALHGGQRLNTDECVMCHNPNANDSARRPADKNPPESIDFKRMIHRIHTGEELTQADPETCKENPDTPGCFTIYGFGGSVNNFNEVRFPGDRRDCEKCHAPDTQQVAENPDPRWIPTVTQRDFYSPQQHYAAACLGCHDSQAAAAHAFSMTVVFPGSGTTAEACATCHGPDADFSVDKVHAR